MVNKKNFDTSHHMECSGKMSKRLFILNKLAEKWSVSEIREKIRNSETFQRGIGSKGFAEFVRLNEGPFKSVRMSVKDLETLQHKPEPVPDWHNYVYTRLKDLGLYRDADYMVDGKAYEYGSAWLKEKLPAEVVKEIESWQEVEKPENELTGLQQYIKDCESRGITFELTGHGLVPSPWNDNTKVKKYVLKISLPEIENRSREFEYFQGTGVKERPKVETVMACLLRDAFIAADGRDSAIEYLTDIGFSNSKAWKTYKQCESILHKLNYLDIFDRDLAEQV